MGNCGFVYLRLNLGFLGVLHIRATAQIFGEVEAHAGGRKFGVICCGECDKTVMQ